MKIRILFLGLLLMTSMFSVKAQSLEFAKMKLRMKIHATTGLAWGSGCSKGVYVNYVYGNGTSFYKGYAADQNQVIQSDSTIFFANLTGTQFTVRGENEDWYETSKWGESSHCYNHADWTNSYNDDILYGYTISSYWSKRYGIANWDGYVEMSFCPANLTIQTSTGPTDGDGLILLEDDRITLNATQGFPSDAYTWKYRITDELTLNDLPQFQDQSSITFNALDLLGNITKFNSLVNSGKKIALTLWAKNADGILVMQGNEIKIYPKFNAPRIQSVTPQKAKCFEDDRSSVVIKFDKALCNQCKLSVGNIIHAQNGTDAFFITSDSLNSNNEYVLKNVYLTAPSVSYDFFINGYYESNGVSKASQYYLRTSAANYSLTERPLKLSASLTKSGVYCYGGQDGKIVGSVNGGTPVYFLYYKNKTTNTIYPTHVFYNPNPAVSITDPTPVSNLSPGDYELTVTDARGCMVKNTITMTQPLSPFVIVESSLTEVSGFGLSNGALLVKLSGGTKLSSPQGYPSPVIVNETGTSFTGQFVSNTGNDYSFTFTNLTAGNYSFTAIDGNLSMIGVSNIRDVTGCKAVASFTIVQPPLLISVMEQLAPIRCYDDASATLIAHAKGGKRYPSGLPYTYQWSYSSDGVLAFVNLVTTDSILANRKAGFYKVKVIDKNNNVSISTYQVLQPEKVAYDVLVKNVTCLNWTDGAISISNLRGGTSPYLIQWPDGSSGNIIDSLSQGMYLLTVSDALGCTSPLSIRVKDTLNGITIEQKSILLPTCYGGKDGSLGISVMVERKPFTITWNTGATDSLLTNLFSGVYTVRVLNANNCLKEASFTLSDPMLIPIDLPEERALCIGQRGEFDIGIKDSLYTYHWKGPNFDTTSAQVSLTDEGLYTATIENIKGCIVKDSVNIYKVNKTIGSQFAAAGQIIAGDEVLLVNITPFDLADTSIWVLNGADLEIVENSLAYARVIFKKAGTYIIGLRSQLGNCVKVEEKELMVFEPTYDHKPYSGSSSSFIKEFEVRPIPNDGHFEVMIRLQDIASVKLRLLDFYSKSDIVEVQQSDSKDYLIPMQVDIANGTYILFLETAYGTRITKLVILK